MNFDEDLDDCCKGSAVIFSYDHFLQAIEFFKADIGFMISRMKEMSDGKKHIDLTIGEYRGKCPVLCSVQ